MMITTHRVAAMGLAAALILTACSGAADTEPGTSAEPPATTTAAPTAGPTTEEPTSEPAGPGLRRYRISDLATGGIEEWVAGPQTFVLSSNSRDESGLRELTVVTAGSPEPWTPEIALPESHTISDQLIATEQNPDSRPAAVLSILSDEAGSGLTGSKQVLTVAVAHPGTGTVDMGSYDIPVPSDAAGGAKLEAVAMVNGVVVTALSWTIRGEDERETFAHRVAFTASGEKTWDRTDVDNRNDPFGAIEKVLPALRAQDLATGDDVVIFAVDDHFVGVRATTGEELYRAPGPYSGGIAVNTIGAFGVDAYNSGGYSDGITVFRTDDGTSFGITSASAVAFDPVTGRTAVSYTIIDGGGSNDAPNIEGTPAIQVLDAEGQAVFTLDRAQAASLGQPGVVSAFDGRMILRIGDGIRVVSLTDGEAEPGFESIPPGAFRLQNVPYIASPHLAVLATTNGYGEMERDFAHSIVVNDEPLSWEDLAIELG